MIQVVILDLTRQFRGGALYPVRFHISTLRLELPLVGLYISMGYVPLVASLSHLANESALAGVQLGVIVLKAREQMAVNVEGHLDGAVSKERLRLLGREPQRDNP